MSKSEEPLECRAVGFDIPVTSWPVSLGRKGPTWFLVFTQPRALQMEREMLPLNALWPSEPFPANSPEGHPRFSLYSPMESKMLDALLNVRVAKDGKDGTRPILKLTGRTLNTNFYGDSVEVEVLLSETKVLHSCANCFKWERAHLPAFLRCSGCKARYYCSEKCQKVNWKEKHKKLCSLLKDGKFLKAERREKVHKDQMQWQQDKWARMGDINHPMERKFDDDIDYEDDDDFAFGARERYLFNESFA
ncbi:hypothetical protein PENSPDRAFT_734503 [Peniophora sp. CONT]|nr:hypothetical protein PENSPDRAFT_734503 [Peniophora sp. CONT]